MIEYKINIPAKHSVVRTIWRKFLKNDQTWHFTLEGDYIELRVAKKRKDLEAYFKLKKWDFSSFEYEDNIPITRKYQKQFEKIFHGYSELSMLVKHEEQSTENEGKNYTEEYQTIERCVHLVFNIFGKSMQMETNWTAGLALDRSRYTGRCEAKQEEKEMKDKES